MLELSGLRDLRVAYHLVQEHVADPVTALLPAWQPPPLSDPPPKSLPLAEFRRRSAAFAAGAQRFIAARDDWQKRVAAACQQFEIEAAAAQMQLTARWQEKIRARGGRDFPRSAVAAPSSTPCAARREPGPF